MFHAADEAAGDHGEADADVHLREERGKGVRERSRSDRSWRTCEGRW